MTSKIHHATARATLALAGALTSLVGFAALTGCEDSSSATDLNAIGGPQIQEVRLKDVTVDAQNITHIATVFGFGTHPDAMPSDEPDPTTLVVAAVGQHFRIIMDQLLEGNYLENISCNAAIDDTGSTFGFVPIGATPDDIAKCAVSSDELPTTCVGPYAVCICEIAVGCGKFTNGKPQFTMGQSVGVLDENQDGAADLHQFRKGAVAIHCGSDGSINVPIDLDNSYWNPSGDQEPPAVPSSQSPFDSIGPAIVLVPSTTDAAGNPTAMPSNTSCTLAFDPNVTNKAGVQVCAAPGGAVPPAASCTPGDTKAFTFKMEALTITLVTPQNGGTLNRTDAIILSANDNIPLNVASLANITITPAVATTTTVDSSGANVTITPVDPTGWPANTTLTLTVPTTVTDTYGQPIVQPITATFTTGM